MKAIFTFFILAATLQFSDLSAQISLNGKVTDGDTGEELIGANIQLKKNNILEGGVSTDFNGNYSINLDAGTYDVIVSYLGYPVQMIKGVIVIVNKANKLDIQMTEPEGCVIICCFGPSPYDPPLIDMDNTSSGLIITDEAIQKSPFRDPKDLIISTPGVSPASY